MRRLDKYLGSGINVDARAATRAMAKGRRIARSCIWGLAGFLTLASSAARAQSLEASYPAEPQRQVAAIAFAGAGLANLDLAASSQEPGQQGVRVQSPWSAAGSLRVGVLWRLSSRGWLADLRWILDYQSSMRHRLKELIPSGAEAKKRARWQSLGVTFAPRLRKSFGGAGALALVPSAGYQLRTWFSPVPGALINHGRHGVSLDLGLGYGLQKPHLELTLAPRAELLFADGALSRRGAKDLRVAVGGSAQLSAWVRGPWCVQARWSYLTGVAGDPDFGSQVFTLGLGFDPEGWTK